MASYQGKLCAQGRKDKFNHAHKHTRYIYIYEYIYSCDFQNQGELDTYLWVITIAIYHLWAQYCTCMRMVCTHIPEYTFSNTSILRSLSSFATFFLLLSPLMTFCPCLHPQPPPPLFLPGLPDSLPAWDSSFKNLNKMPLHLTEHNGPLFKAKQHFSYHCLQGKTHSALCSDIMVTQALLTYG